MISPNGYKTGLYSGDVGIALKNQDGQLRVWFEGDNALRGFLPSALPAHDCVYAMTIHKSHGSEFDSVTLVLPVLTRELFYTGLTRGREQLSIYSQRNALEQTVTRRVLRVSGLAERIAQPGEK
ncbi:ATP-binding domain-containing protein [Salinisphaera sp.]|uniref:ATP-binding domain-containing protein n=1 Tax=Salinisphaera sp. TaxID=1914330 RepID=UPI00344B83A7